VIGFEESDIAKLTEFLEQKKDSSDDCEYRSMDWKPKTDSALRVMLSNLQSVCVPADARCAFTLRFDLLISCATLSAMMLGC